MLHSSTMMRFTFCRAARNEFSASTDRPHSLRIADAKRLVHRRPVYRRRSHTSGRASDVRVVDGIMLLIEPIARFHKLSQPVRLATSSRSVEDLKLFVFPIVVNSYV